MVTMTAGRLVDGPAWPRGHGWRDHGYMTECYRGRYAPSTGAV